MANKTEKPTAKPDSKVFDVAKPGASVAQATARPVIVSNRPLMQDPMMLTEQAEPTSAPAITTTKIVIKPISEDDESSKTPTPEKPSTDEEASSASDKPVVTNSITPPPSAAEPAANPPAPEEEAPAASEGKAAEPETTKTEEPAEEAESSRGDEDGEQSAAEKTKTEQETAALEAETKHQAELDKLVESKQYVLPINAVEKRRSKQAVLLGILLILVLAAAWTDVAMDSGLIHIKGLSPVTHFFQNK